MALIEEFPALTKSEPISFGSNRHRKTRTTGLVSNASGHSTETLSSQTSKKKRPKKQQKRLTALQDDCFQVHSADEASELPSRNKTEQFGSVASIWRQNNRNEQSSTTLLRTSTDSPLRAAEDEGFVDGLIESHSTTALLPDGTQCCTDSSHFPSLPGCQCDTPSDIGRSRQDSSSENNSVVFGSPDLPKLWDFPGQDGGISTSTKDAEPSRNPIPATSAHGATGDVGDVDEDELEGSDLLHLISNSLDRFNEIVHPHELNPENRFLMSVDSVDLCSSGYGSFDQQQQPRRLVVGGPNDKFSLDEFTATLEDETNANTVSWLPTSRPVASTQCVAGDCDSAATKNPLSTMDSTTTSQPFVNRRLPSLSADPTLQHCCPSLSKSAQSGPNESTNTAAQSFTDWGELLASAVRALQEPPDQSAGLNIESIPTTLNLGEVGRHTRPMDSMLTSLNLLGINDTATTASWEQKSLVDKTGERLFSIPPRVHRNTLTSMDLEYLHNHQQLQEARQNAGGPCGGRRSVLSACFPSSTLTGGFGSETKLLSGTNPSSLNSACLFDRKNAVPYNNPQSSLSEQTALLNPSSSSLSSNNQHPNSRGGPPQRNARRQNLPPPPPHNFIPTAAAGGLSSDPSSLPYLLSNSKPSLNVPGGGGGGPMARTTPLGAASSFLFDSKSSSNRPIVFHLQEFLRHNTGNRKGLQHDCVRPSVQHHTARAAATIHSPTTHHISKASSNPTSGHNSSGSSTCGMTANTTDASADVAGAAAKPVIAKWRRACSFYLRGHCKKEDCEFAHDLTKVTCKFWEMGECFKGPTCPFLHGYPPELLSPDQ